MQTNIYEESLEKEYHSILEFKKKFDELIESISISVESYNGTTHKC